MFIRKINIGFQFFTCSFLFLLFVSLQLQIITPMTLKYESEVITRKKCNLARFTERENRQSFCWCFSPIDDSKNFIPRAIAVKRDNCESWALSFYDTQKQAEDKLGDIAKGKPNMYKYLGDHIATGVLDENDGISEESGQDGHFNHHEYNGTDFAKKFTVIKKVA